MIRIATFLLGLCTLCQAFAASPSNFVVFGDSLSDIGNFPQSHYVHIYDPANILSKKADSLIESQFVYIPVTNPITISGTSYNLVTPTGTTATLNYPQFNSMGRFVIPSPQSKIADSNNRTQPVTATQQRSDRSIGWVEYLFANLYSGQTKARLATSQLLPSITADSHTSVDAAWYSALSNNQCQDEDYGQATACTAAQIKQSAKQFRQTQTPETLANLPTNVHIPGMLQQVNMFVNQYAGKPVMNADTRYIMFIGGNDLSDAFSHLNLSGISGFPTAINVDKAIKVLLSHHVPADHIYVLNLFNLGLTPKGHNTTGGPIIAPIATGLYNFFLSLTASNDKVHLIDVNALYKKMAAALKSTQYQACQAQSKDIDGLLASGKAPGPMTSYTSGQTASECGTYMFWNHVHPSSLMQQQLGYLVSQAILSNSKTDIPAQIDPVKANLFVAKQTKLLAQAVSQIKH